MDNTLTFMIPGVSGLTNLSIQLIDEDGDAIGTPITVTETGVAGLYKATMTGAPGYYGSVILYDTTPIFHGNPFIWNGTSVEVSGSGAGLGPDELARLERIENQLIADVRKGASRYQRLLPGTETVILDKDVAFDLTEGYVLTDHE